jgi:hypothetical protein
MKKILSSIVAVALATAAYGANLAYDDASDPAYSNGWLNGSNGGYGFGAWQLTFNVGTGTFDVGSSTLNGDGLDDGTTGGQANDGDIDTGMFLPVAWGIIPDPMSQLQAIRPFTGGALALGQTFSVYFDNGFLIYNSWSLIGLMSGYSSVLELNISPYGYQYADANTNVVTGMGFGDEGFRFEVTMTGPTSYVATLSRLDGSNVTWSGSMTAAPDSFYAVHGIMAPIVEPGVDFYLNRMEIVPEPSIIALGSIGVLGFAIRAYLRRIRKPGKVRAID